MKNGYIAGFENKKIEIRADNIADAKRKANEHFKPSKRKTGLVWVMLAELNGQEVHHVAVD